MANLLDRERASVVKDLHIDIDRTIGGRKVAAAREWPGLALGKKSEEMV